MAKQRGRPTTCTPEIAERICTQLAEGNSLRAVCEDPDMPAKSSVLLWVVTGREVEGTDQRFSDQYHDAREAAGYSHADEALELRAEVRNGMLEPNAAKVILDSLKWGAERMAPKRHASRQEHDHTTQGDKMPAPQITFVGVNDETTSD